MLITAFCDQ